jgi:hypothetical protein
MISMKRARTLLVSAFAGGGVLVAHSLGYLFAGHEDPHGEAGLLAATGHNYFVYLAALVTALSVFLLSRYASRRLSDKASPEVSGVQLFAQAAVRLIFLQVVGFLALEFIERLASAHGMTNVLAEPAVQLGLLFQVVVAVAGALILSLFAGAVEAIRRRTRFASARRHTVRIYPKVTATRPRRLTLAESGTGLRGPPTLA